MWIHIDPVGGTPIYMQIKDQIKRATASGLLQAGDQLPSVRELAVQLTVNPNTVSRAYLELERDGVIKTVRGVGTFVSEKEVKILHEERIKTLSKSIDKVFIEAHHLGIDEDEVKQLFEERLRDWKVNRK